nr:FAD-dependent oxidoreductase [Actinomycetota bacterium]
RAGVIQVSHLDDRPTRFHLGGRMAASIKEAVCKGTVWQLGREARKPGSYVLLPGGGRAERLAAAEQSTPVR